MKKLFTVFCAVCLMPTFSAQAWIGGPFSNNSFFGENGDDGVYEAAATAVNGIGLFRIVVGNNFDGVNTTGVTTSIPGTVIVEDGLIGIPVATRPIGSGNVVIGALGSTSSNVWYLNGIFYAGNCLGTASSVMGIVQAIGQATNTAATSLLGSAFTASFSGRGRFFPARAFSGAGQYQVTGVGAIGPLGFSVFGSKVSSRITFGL